MKIQLLHYEFEHIMVKVFDVYYTTKKINDVQFQT